ncbi:MAG TPA: cytochrome c1 [Alphaproteobacteria bacterium]|jgi:ubiquinol-cytochrome c reductase cytochrome c1 subunit
MRLAIAAGLVLATLSAAATANAAEAEKPKSQSWTFDGVFGTFDRKQLQRGLKVYTTICAGCHGMRHLYYRNLVEIGLTPSEAKAVAATKEVDDIGDDGQPKKRKADLKDRFVSPFPNVQAAAAANNNKAPPDLSLIVKARAGGADYVHALLTGYSEPPKDWKDEDGKPRKLESGQNYNKYFPGNVIAMAPPLASDGQVEYGKDDPKPTIEQMAKDVAAFLAWASEPTMEERKRTGIKVILFLLLATGVFFVIYRRVWKNVH